MLRKNNYILFLEQHGGAYYANDIDGLCAALGAPRESATKIYRGVVTQGYRHVGWVVGPFKFTMYKPHEPYVGGIGKYGHLEPVENK